MLIIQVGFYYISVLPLRFIFGIVLKKYVFLSHNTALKALGEMGSCFLQKWYRKNVLRKSFVVKKQDLNKECIHKISKCTPTRKLIYLVPQKKCFTFYSITFFPSLNSHFQVRAKFTVDDHSHYLFTPCILTQWVLGLFRYDLEGGKSLTWLSLIKKF